MASKVHPIGVVVEGDISPLETGIEDMTKLENTTDKCTVISKEVKTLKPGVPTVMIAGKDRSGKSTALNNMFGLKLAARASAASVTSALSITEVIKEVPRMSDTSPQEVTVQVIDTPGLGALGMSKQEILDEMKRVTKGVNFTLLYCFSVTTSNSVTEIDKSIVTNLQHVFGIEEWKKCVLLFTFSDHAYSEFEDSPAEYVHYINDHAQKFDELLRDISGNKSCVRSIFEYGSPKALLEEENPSNIIAIPVKKKVAQSKDILLDMIESGQD